jgi:hypothetical protein
MLHKTDNVLWYRKCPYVEKRNEENSNFRIANGQKNARLRQANEIDPPTKFDWNRTSRR